MHYVNKKLFLFRNRTPFAVSTKIAKWLRPYMTYVLPVIVGIILVFGLYNFFAA